MGINTTLYKVLAFAIAGFRSAAAGGIHAYWITYGDPAGSFEGSLNVKMVIMTLFGGPGTIFGPVIGSFLLSAVFEVLAKVSSAASLFYGFVIVLAVIFMPRGLLDVIEGVRRSGLHYFAANMRRYR